MSTLRAFYHLARADFLKRTRRYSFLVTLAAVLYLAYGVHQGTVSVQLDRYRGVLDSAWVGGMLAMVTTTFMSLAGFYVVKNAVERDRRTHVGEILATTPLSRPLYTLGKAASHFAVLALLVAILALAAPVLQLLGGEESHLSLGPLLLPFAILVLPALALVAAVAILFETLPVLRGGIGNVVYFFTWTAGLAVSVEGKGPLADPLGFRILASSMQAAARARFPDYRGGFSLTIAPRPDAAASFVWGGAHWTSEILTSRLLWLGIAAAIAVLAAVPFHRFDPARSEGMRQSRPKRGKDGVGAESAEAALPSAPASAPHAAPASAAAAAHALGAAQPVAGPAAFARMVQGELRLLLKGLPWGWFLVAGGLWLAGLLSPLAIARGVFLPLAWFWPILLWSGMGSREMRFGTDALVFSCARSLTLQLPAAWTAGWLLALATGSAVGLRLALAGDGTGVLAWGVGSLLIPSAAIALGTMSGGSRLFEILYTLAWYVGPMNHTAVDFTGATPAAVAQGAPLVCLALAAALLAAAAAARARQSRL